jgi:PTS system mannose-specific IIA component
VSVSLLIISHDDIGDSLLNAAIGILGFCPLRTLTLAVSKEDSLENIDNQANRMLAELQGTEGTLILTDLQGSTPSNVAARLERSGLVRVVAGLNLPMLIRVLSHSGDNLEHLVSLALDGGRQGVMPGKPQSTDTSSLQKV